MTDGANTMASADTLLAAGRAVHRPVDPMFSERPPQIRYSIPKTM